MSVRNRPLAAMLLCLLLVQLTACSGSRDDRGYLGGSSPTAPTTPDTTPTKSKAGVPSSVIPFGWGGSMFPELIVLGGESGIIVRDALRMPVPGARVRFEIVTGTARVDSVQVVADARGIASFGALRIPAAPSTSVLRVHVNGTPFEDFPIQSVVPDTGVVTGTFALTFIDGRWLPMDYRGFTPPIIGSLVGGTLTIEPARYEFLIAVDAADGTHLTLRKTGQVIRLSAGTSLANMMLRPDGLPADTYFDTNRALVATDGRLQVLNEADDGWPLPGLQAEFRRIR